MEPGTDREPSTNQFQSVQHIQVDEQQHNRRIDNFLISLLSLPKSRVYRMIRKGEVRVNKKRVKSDCRVKQGDTVRIPPVYQESSAQANIPSHIQQRLLDAVIYEDDRYLVLNKPSGIPVHAGSGLRFGVIEAFKAQETYKDGFIELAHRLDRDTSGCLLLVKQAKALREVHSVLNDDETKKRYLALLKGQWKGGARMVDFPLVKNQPRSGERFVAVSEDGKPAKSEFSPIIGNDDCTLVEVLLHTGRTHQIRVHAAAIGMPVAGDLKYGDEAFNQAMRERGLRRLFLHAKSLSFKPKTTDNKNSLSMLNECLSFEAPLDEQLNSLLEKLGFSEE